MASKESKGADWLAPAVPTSDDGLRNYFIGCLLSGYASNPGFNPICGKTYRIALVESAFDRATEMMALIKKRDELANKSD